MHSNKPLFSPEPSSAGEYVMVVLALLNNFHKTLRERQSQCLSKARWGQPVIPGKHATFTLDRKHRGIPNVYDTDPNAPESADEADICDPPQTEAASCRSEDPDVVHPKLLESELAENSVLASEPNVLVQTEEPLKSAALPIPESSLHSNQEDNPNWKAKRQKLCKKLSNKENHKQKMKICCLQRRSLFRKCQPGVASVLPSSHETQELNTNQMQASLSNILPNGVITTSLDTNLTECLEENIYSCDPLSVIAVSPVSKESPLNNKFSSPPRPSNLENDKGSPLRESNPSNSCDEILSCSPVFSAYESPFRNSELVSYLKDNSMAKAEESAESVGSLINAKEMSSELHPKPHSRFLESEAQDSVDEQMNKNKSLKMAVAKKLPKQKPMVQCPLCCDWFKPKVIERHAANCGIIAPMQFDGAAQSNNSIASAPNEHEIKKETCNLNHPSESESSKLDPTRNGKKSDMLEIENAEKTVETAVQNVQHSFPIDKNSKEPTRHSPSLDDFVLEQVEKSVITFGNNMTEHPSKTDCVLPEIQPETSDLIPALKRCFICDLSYAEGKPFSTHLRTCRKKYQKLKRQFSGLSEECEEPQRKTRSRSFQATNMNYRDTQKNFNSNSNT